MTLTGLTRRLAVLALVSQSACSGSPPPDPVPAAPPSSAPKVDEKPAPPPTTSASSSPSAAPIASAAPTVAPLVSAAPSAPPSPCPPEMAFIPGGEYAFGMTRKEKVTVAVKPFCIDLDETTVGAYEACAKAGKCDAARLTVCDPSTYGKPHGDKTPMVCVDFDQAAAYCKAQEKRLLSTEEWEWAARGASPTAAFPWGEGDLEGRICWRKSGPCDVGSFPKGNSPQGVRDLLGGVFEWTTSKTDSTASTRIVRGASWKDYPAELFSVSRQGAFKSSYRCGFGGIRCARSAP